MNKAIFQKTAMAIVLCFAFAFSAQSQDAFKKSDLVANFGIGLLNYNGSGYSTTFPPITASVEYGIIDEVFNEYSKIGVGAILGYYGDKYKTIAYTNTYSHFLVGTRGSFHYLFVDKLDTYGGLMIGYDVASYKRKWNSGYTEFSTLNNDDTEFSFQYGLFVGARYYFAESFGVFAEAGYGISALNLGFTLKF